MDNAKVQGYIDESFDQQNRVYKGIARLSQAHAWLYQKRQSDDPNDDNDELAAAEHYMWARWKVAADEIDIIIMHLLVLGYDAFKLLGYLPPVFVARKAGGHNWSTPSADSIRWGNGGIADGRRDQEILKQFPDAQVR